jgi:hypothetical protein
VAALTIGFGGTCTVFSEWMNVVVRQTWAYSDLMSIVRSSASASRRCCNGWPFR